MSERAPGFAAEYRDLIGKPFKLGARGPDSFDCYGLVMELARREGRVVPDYRSPETLRDVQRMIAHSIPMWVKCECGPGAVVVLRTKLVVHVGMVLPFGKFIHAWEHAGGVCVERIDDWRSQVIGTYTYKNK